MIRKNLILSDIDGTFLGKRSRQVERNRIAIERFKQNGGLFTFSSGRSEITMKDIIPDAEHIVNAPAILTNGSYIYDYVTRQKHYYTPVNAEKAIPLLEAMLKTCPGTSIRINHYDTFMSNELSEAFARETKGMVDRREIYPFDRMPRDGWNKAVVHGTAAALESAKTFLSAHAGSEFAITLSGPNLLEIVDSGATKGTMIARLREYYEEKGIEVKVYAVGDYENDLEMLQMADVAVCPSNAIEKVKAVCETVLCDHDEGAIADLIEKIETKIL
ncbi:MAG: HAD-IIB family hydrolase [Ruminococcaceae bacterium]|nr:HAD-IIB family hydrolase [Oscillospiraceae bacterium]